MSTVTTEPGNVNFCLHPGDDAPTASVSPCFHPGDEDGTPAARHVEPVSPCFHPGDDLATDLHFALTRDDERELAVLAGHR